MPIIVLLTNTGQGDRFKYLPDGRPEAGRENYTYYNSPDEAPADVQARLTEDTLPDITAGRTASEVYRNPPPESKYGPEPRIPQPQAETGGLAAPSFNPGFQTQPPSTYRRTYGPSNAELGYTPPASPATVVQSPAYRPANGGSFPTATGQLPEDIRNGRLAATVDVQGNLSGRLSPDQGPYPDPTASQFVPQPGVTRGFSPQAAVMPGGSTGGLPNDLFGNSTGPMTPAETAYDPTQGAKYPAGQTVRLHVAGNSGLPLSVPPGTTLNPTELSYITADGIRMVYNRSLGTWVVAP